VRSIASNICFIQPNREKCHPASVTTKRERLKSKIKVACIHSLWPSSHFPYESQIQILPKALALLSSLHDVMYRKVFLSLNLSAHASSPVIRYTSKGSEKMLVILRQGLHLFPKKEAFSLQCSLGCVLRRK